MILFFCYGGLAEGFVSFSGFIFILVFPYVSGGRNCFVLLSSKVLRGGRMGSSFEGIDFSYEGVKQVVGLFIGFVFAIASAPCDFLYLNQRKYDIKKKKK